jgi:hypothetical protein
LDAGLRSRRRGHKCVAEDAVQYDIFRGEKPLTFQTPTKLSAGDEPQNRGLVGVQRPDSVAGLRGFELADLESQYLPSHGARPEPTGAAQLAADDNSRATSTSCQNDVCEFESSQPSQAVGSARENNAARLSPPAPSRVEEALRKRLRTGCFHRRCRLAARAEAAVPPAGQASVQPFSVVLTLALAAPPAAARSTNQVSSPTGLARAARQ